MCSSLNLEEQVLEKDTESCVCLCRKYIISCVSLRSEAHKNACKNITVFLGRGWKTKKSNIRVDAEARAKEVIKEDYQKLGPTK